MVCRLLIFVMSQYGLAEDTSRSGQKMNTKELPPADLYSLSAVYIAAAHALKPEYPVYRGALRLVRSMVTFLLPLDVS
jgi:hypothetical protein